MKKVLAICLMVIMVVSMSVGVSAVAAPNGFVGSPSGNLGPKVISYTLSPAGCGMLVVTPYADLEKLPVDEQALLKRGYNAIVDAENIAQLNKDLAELAKKERIKAEDLAVSDLFDMRLVGCDKHRTHKMIDVVLEADTLENFVGLLHMKKNGEFELIKGAEIIKGKDVVVNEDIVVDAEITEDGKYLRFTVESLSPFAIVVNTGEPSPNYLWLFLLLLLLILVIILIIVYNKNKKKAAAETKAAK